jgi:small subunit ribosomal protein S3
MGQKVNPIGLRLGIVKGWESNWYGGKDFSEKLVEDDKIRKYVMARVPKGGVARIIIERNLKRVTLTIQTARPGVVIGKGGNEVDKIKEELKKLTGKDIQINIFEIKRPELDSQLVADTVAQQLRARISYRKAMKQAIQGAIRVGAEGIKIKVSGRLGGADMARTEQYKEGRVPLHTLRADIDYAVAEADTVYGKIGVKVWICKGEVYGKPDLYPYLNAENTTNASSGNNNNNTSGNKDFKKGGGKGGNNRGGNGGRDRDRNNNRRKNDK